MLLLELTTLYHSITCIMVLGQSPLDNQIPANYQWDNYPPPPPRIITPWKIVLDLYVFSDKILFFILYFLKGYPSASGAPQCWKETHFLENCTFSCKIVIFSRRASRIERMIQRFHIPPNKNKKICFY